MPENPQPKYHWLSEATNDHFWISASRDSDGSEKPNERTVDPWDRPDILNYGSTDPQTLDAFDEAVSAFALSDSLPDHADNADIAGGVTELCPCCGAALPGPRWPGDICPQCWWEFDPFAASSTEPSDCNHGLSLEDARWNFHTFGVSDPTFLTQGID